MRGKKKDPEFLSKFIAECVGNNKFTAEEIVSEAKNRISVIDNKIKEVENLKLVRSKLLDVISTFDESAKVISSKEIKALEFFKIQYPNICKEICNNLKTTNMDISWLHSKFSNQDIVFCIKQLLELKIITKMGSCLLRGEAFDDYLNFVFQEK
jgi:hypothetical protein